MKEKTKNYIDVADGYRLVVLDELNIAVEKLVTVNNKKTGEKRQEWEIQGYYYKLKNALNAAMRCIAEGMMRGSVSGCKDLEELGRKIDRVYELIEKFGFDKGLLRDAERTK